jgi:putative Mg2+ transporter-C (MgtC) family protein
MHPFEWLSVEPRGQTALQVAELMLALVLSSFIGLEREFKMKSAGLRTHTLVGVASALIVLVSKYGFTNILVPYEVVLDPSRIAAQIVSGIGFIGGGLIFVQRDVVRGLTTAAIIWLTAAVGMACGAGLPMLAVFVTGVHFLVVYAYKPLTQRILAEQAEFVIQYVPGRGAIQEIMQLCTGRGFSVQEVSVQREDASADSQLRKIRMRLLGRRNREALIVSMGDIDGVTAVLMTPMKNAGD